MKKLIGLMLAMTISIAAHARPFSTNEEMKYLTETISRIAESDGFTLDNSSLTLETWGVILNPIYNSIPFLGLNRPIDDRYYTVYFLLKKGSDTFDASTHFRSTAGSRCGPENNTTIRSHSVLNGQENCMTLRVSPELRDFAKPITTDVMLGRQQ